LKDSKFPTLAILPLKSLVIHEHHDDSRMQPLIDRIKEAGVIRNPVIVTPLHDHTARYMVLDGANRTTAFDKMGIQHILTQVVESDNLGLETETWNHVIWDLDRDVFLKGIEAISGLEVRPSNPETANDAVLTKRGLVALHLPSGQAFEVYAPAVTLIDRNKFLNAIVNSYKNRAKMDRTSHRNVGNLRKLYPTLSGLIFMPLLKVRHILYLVSQGQKLPAGVTRFTVSPRALRVNYPLGELTSDDPLEAKNDALNALIQDRIANKGIRHYVEETVLFDE